MTITRKPKATTAASFIEQGGSAAISTNLEQDADSVPSDGQRGRPRKEKEAEIGVKLRLPTSLLARIDDAVESRQPLLSRHQWILEAIYAKLDR